MSILLTFFFTSYESVEMILSAIEALNEYEGSSEASISKHLQQARSTSRRTTVAAQVEKRGRGRPPKPKSDAQLAANAVVSPPIGRGRPPKNPNVEPATKKLKTVTEGGSGSGRPCGRPRKFPLLTGGEVVVADR
ncbi:hypothetical protein ACFE04_021794 [Oxalis oulophora]